MDGKPTDALKLFEKAGDVEVEFLTQVQLAAEKTESALKRAGDHVKRHKNEVVPLASLVETLWQAGKRDEAKKQFQTLREVARHADLDNPVLARLTPIATAMELPNDWRTTQTKPANDVGQRPELDALGPFRWQPTAAKPWSLTDVNGTKRSLADYQGKPVVVIFYLGYGCLHCAEQLQSFAPMTQEFEKAGLSLIAISTDSPAKLSEAHKLYKEGAFPFPLVSNSNLDVFRQYRVFDDFEEMPLHGTFLIDGNGRIRWHDISYEPFNNPKFLLGEAKRLLAQPIAEQSTRRSEPSIGD